jgi:cobalt-zinc-cadmium efflux system outer membrane protein
MKKTILLFLILLFPLLLTAQDKGGILTLEKALELALAHHPSLEVARQDIEVAKGHRTQAGMLPNPRVLLGSEALNPAEGISSEGAFLFGVSQELPIFGSMTKNKRLEEKEIALKESQHAIALLEVSTKVKGTYATALYWQQVLEILEQLVADSQKELEISKSRLEAGDIIPAEVAEKELLLSNVVVEINKIRSRKESAFAQLLEAMGNPEVEIGKIAGQLIKHGDVPALNDLLFKLDSNPYLLREMAQVDVSKANLDKVRNSRYPDLELEFKHRWVNEISESRYDFGLSLTLPVFDFKQGETAAAAAKLKMAGAHQIARKNALVSRLRAAHAALVECNDSLKLIAEKTFPEMEKQFQIATALYEEGEISLLEYLPHRRTYNRGRLQMLMNQKETLLAWVEIYPFVL